MDAKLNFVKQLCYLPIICSYAARNMMVSLSSYKSLEITIDEICKILFSTISLLSTD